MGDQNETPGILTLPENRVDAIREIADRVYEVRGRIWGKLSAGTLSFRDQGTNRAEEGDTEDRGADTEDRGAEAPKTRAEEGDDDAPTSGTVVVTGIASSTGVDWYGTEMHVDALHSMATQFRAGISYLPTHGDSEWDDVFGETVAARVIPGPVKDPAEPGEASFILEVDAELDMSEERARKLWRRLRARRKVGQSIGGWFTRVVVHEDEYGRILRMIVMEVELDHLAVTRTPANTDADDLSLKSQIGSLKSQIGETVTAWRARSATPSTPSPSTPSTEASVRSKTPETRTDDTEETPETAQAAPEVSDDDRSTDTPDSPEVPETDNRTDADATDPGPARSVPESTPPATAEEENMPTSEELAALLSQTVATALSPVTERLSALESRFAAPETSDDTDDDTESPEAARVRELEAELALRDRIGAPTNGRAIRKTEAYRANIYDAAEAAEEGDWGPLIARAKEEGRAPSVVRLTERSANLKRLRSLDLDNAKELGFSEPKEVRSAFRKALPELLRAADRDGLLDHLNPLKAADSRSGWSGR